MKEIDIQDTDDKFHLKLNVSYSYMKRIFISNLFSIFVFLSCFLFTGGLSGNYLSYFFIIPLIITFTFGKERAVFYVFEIKIDSSNVYLKYMFKNQTQEIITNTNKVSIRKEQIKAKHKGQYIMNVYIEDKCIIHQNKIGAWEYSLMDKVCSSLINKQEA